MPLQLRSLHTTNVNVYLITRLKWEEWMVKIFQCIVRAGKSFNVDISSKPEVSNLKYKISFNVSSNVVKTERGSLLLCDHELNI